MLPGTFERNFLPVPVKRMQTGETRETGENGGKRKMTEK